MNYKLINNVIGWIVFAIALFVYGSTIESSVSFWDCGEFIPGCYKLQVMHPPGAPLFLMIGKIFTLFAGSNIEMVPVMVNFMSAVCTAFVSLFIFWTITHIVRNLIDKNRENKMESILLIMGSGVVGALACTFLDSMWFSAVEGEVYAMSMFFTALIVWAIFKWEEVADEPGGDRWLIFIAYICGLSIGVHLLNLVAIPGLVLIYFFKRREHTRKNLLIALLVAALLLVFIVFGIIPLTMSLAVFFEKLFVNSFGLPFNSGLYFTILLIIGLLLFGFSYAKRKNKALLHNALLGLTFILIGYSTYAMVFIRSNADPSIDMNNPDNPVSMLSYINREQYGDRPLAVGQYFDAEVVDYNDEGLQYAKNTKTGKYEVVGKKFSYKFDPNRQTIFPRIHASEHAKRYRDYLGLTAKEKPNFSDNMSFFFSYQFGWMYWRYFMWNFAGRQNDVQGFGTDPNKGNWMSGISVIDNMRLGPQENMPESMTSNKARNKFYMIPFILGLLGMFFHFQTKRREAFAILTLFVFTGIMLVVYFNSPPIEPRERDYTMVGSFYVFCIWIGISVVALWDMMKKKLSPKISAVIAICIAMIAPVLMGFQGWDDHDRSDRYTAIDFASNYLNSCAPNAILFTQGDNDTYPLWYAQEVGGVRKDVRVVNLSLIAVDWYINQQRRKVNGADAVKMSIPEEKIWGDRRNQLPFAEEPSINPNNYYDLGEILKFVVNDDKRAKRQTRGGEEINFLPTKKFKLKVDPQSAMKAGFTNDPTRLLPEINFEIKGNGITKDELMILDIIQSNAWERPIYWAVSVSPDKFMGLDQHLSLEGLTYRLSPLNDTLRDQAGDLQNTEACYKNLTEKFKFGNPKDKDLYYDENILRMFYNLRSIYARVAELLYRKGEKDKALKVLETGLKGMPEKNVPYNVYMLSNVQLYYKMTTPDKVKPYAISLAKTMANDYKYYNSLPSSTKKLYERELNTCQYVLNELQKSAKGAGDTSTESELKALASGK